MVAMGIMVASFRVSVDDWILHILPADLYVRSSAGGNTGGFGPQEQAALADVPGVARSAFLRTRPLSLDPARPNIVLVARDIDALDPGRMLALVGDTAPIPAGSRPVWISEAMTDLYRLKVGQAVTLPLGGRPQPFFIAGVWRDYANQTGSAVVRLADYRALTGDTTVTDAALWAAPGADVAQIEGALRRLPFGPALQMARPGDIRAMSLKIFDRSFAVTYLLEAIAIAIGLSGVAATFSAQTLARAKEFGMLRHVGVTRRQVLGILAVEGGALTALGVLTGFVLGLVISLILVSGRYALSGGPVRAVREDW
jgi:putative ABC transport system permease protein